jgi:3-methyladenine DNA glycosylase AlkD
VRAAQARLRAGADAERAAKAARYFPSRPPILGAESGLARELGAELGRALAGRGSHAEIVQAAEMLYATGVMEDGACANEALARVWRFLTPDDWDAFEGWIRQFTCWATTDSFCLKVLGHLVVRDGPPRERLLSWSGSDSVWLRRAACASLIRAARQATHESLLFQICDQLLGDPEPMVQKALGWTLKELGKGDLEGVISYLRQRGARLAPLTLRHATERMTADQKARVRSA